jgi:hypothetical protein
MTFQIIRKDGKVRGIALMLGGSKVTGVAGEKTEYWRICDHCTVNEAVVFCHTHARYVCTHCLLWHGRTQAGGPFILGFPCYEVSMAVLRDAATIALSQLEVEA